MPRLRDARSSDLPSLAAMAADSEIGRRYGFDAAALAAKLAAAVASGALLLVAEEEGAPEPPIPSPAQSEPRGQGGSESSESDAARLLGFAWVDPRGAFGACPYLKLIATRPDLRGGGIGSLLMDKYEARTKDVGRYWTLMVSDFNLRARRFYERRGYEKVGEFPDFACEGVTEILMAKRKR